MRLDRAAIAGLIPHAGRMVLLDEVVERDDARIVCTSTTHRDPDHPLATRGTLSSVCGIEFAAQAMAVHGALAARDESAAAKPRAGFLAAVRDVAMHADRLDDVAGALTIEAVRDAGDDRNVIYRFAVRDGARVLVEGRATVVLAFDHIALERPMSDG